jgi:GTP cyclohydrolase IA
VRTSKHASLDMERAENHPLRLALSTKRARLSAQERRRFELHLAEILHALGLAETESTAATPARLLQAWIDATSGYEADPKLVTLFPAEAGEPGGSAQVVEGPIAFTSLCEHHVLPFMGDAWVGYEVSDTMIGLSKLTRLVQRHARRFTMQERMGKDIARELHTIVGARGTAVRIACTHLCTRMRGVREAGALTTTATWLGSYEESESLRREFLQLCEPR